VSKLPDNVERYAAEAERIHREVGWEYRRWGNELYEKYADDPYVRYYVNVIVPSPNGEKWTAILADRLRLLILRDHGGVFTDIDVEFMRTFEPVLADELAPDTHFFAGLRRQAADVPMLEVAVLGSIPGAAPIEAALREYARFTPPAQITSPDQILLPLGGDVGKWLATGLDGHSVLLNYRYFYIDDRHKTPQTVLMNRIMQTWVASNAQAFRVVLPNCADRRLPLDMLVAVTKLCHEHMDVPPSEGPWLGGDQLAGLARNGTMQPWSDAFDLYLPRQYAGNVDAMKQPLAKLGYAFHAFANGFKVWPASAKPIPKYKWAWPFLEVKYVEDSGDNYLLPMGAVQAGIGETRLSKLGVVPTQTVRIEDGCSGFGVDLPVPRDHNSVLRAFFGRDWASTCRSRWWNRQIEQGVRSKLVRCQELPFAWNRMRGLTIEERAGANGKSGSFDFQLFTPPLDFNQLNAFGSKVPLSARVELLELTRDMLQTIIDRTGPDVSVWLANDALQYMVELDGWAVPSWSDAVDLFMDHDERTKWEADGAYTIALRNLPKPIEVVPFWGGMKVFYANSSRPQPDLAWAFPSVEVRFFTNANHTLHMPGTGHTSTLPEAAVLPVRMKNVHGPNGIQFQVPVPANSTAVVETLLGFDTASQHLCRSRSWDRVREAPVSTAMVRVACENLKQFVK